MPERFHRRGAEDAKTMNRNTLFSIRDTKANSAPIPFASSALFAPLRFIALVALLCSATPSRAEVETIVTPNVEFARVDDKPLFLDLHMPKGVANPPLVVFMHGGSWRAGQRTNPAMKWIVSKGFALASIDYRLSQQAVFPAQIFDCKGAVRWLRANASKYGYDARRIAISGASAGGHLAVLLGTSGDEKELEGEVGGHPEASSRVQAIVDFYGPTDFILRAKEQPEFTDKPTGQVFQLLGHGVKEREDRAKLASGAWHVTADDPPLLAIHGTKDARVRPNQTQRIHDAYQALGLESSVHLVEGAGHGGKGFDTAEVQAVVTAFLEKHLKSKSGTN